ncbi:hypothetical protein ABZ958_03335 [Streptomyces sp. NPDC046237]|uniref:hypothetical protein n=1 Tax=Streptomyces sp. NPDC046237 TaxID=3154914 RepID=UPI0033FA0189
MPLTLITMPSDADLAWAEHEARQQIIDRYIDARTQTEATAVRWDAIEYDRANPLASSLVAELDTYDQLVAA